MPELDPEPMWNDYVGRHQYYPVTCDKTSCVFMPRHGMGFSTNSDDYFMTGV